MKLKLYGAMLSPFVRKVRVMLALKKIDYDIDVQVSPLSVPEGYEKIHPLKKIPALVIDDADREIALADSSAIAGFLDKLEPSLSFYPSDPIDYGQALWLEEYGDTFIAQNCTFGVFGNVFFSWARGETYDAEKIKMAFKHMEEVITYVESILGDRDWLIGDRMTIADIGVMTHFFNVEHAGYRLTEADSPTLYGLKKRIEEHADIAPILAEERIVIQKLKFESPDLTALRH